MTNHHNQEHDILSLLKDKGVKKVKVAVTDIDGVLRGKYIHIKKLESALEKGFGFCNVIMGWDIGDNCYLNTNKDYFTGWGSGYPDNPAHLDLNTIREVPWDNNVPFILGQLTDEKGTPLDVDPRGVLQKVIQKSKDMGFDSYFAQEFEWFNFKEVPESLEAKKFIEPEPLTPGMFGYSLLRASQNREYFNALFDQLEAFKVPLEGIHTETGPGVFEAAILYSTPLKAADRAILFKTAVKEIAQDFGIIPSFMAKWSNKYPGCSGHIHQSLWKNNENAFYAEGKKLSPLMEHYMAGVLKALPEILPLYAPTINSYKRLVEGAWAPTTLTWGIDNRTCALRALPLDPKSSRLEMRVPGSDANPYLAMAACLASGLWGIENKLPLSPETKGNGYQSIGDGRLPQNLSVATEKMKKSQIARDLFGENFVKHFTMSREWEWNEYNVAVNDWEMKRYFEIV